jgi:hypothetical protein
MKSLNKTANVEKRVTFNKLAKQMPKLLKRLKAEPIRTRGNLKDIPEKGVYVFYEKGKPLYVGRSNRLKKRLLEHGQEGCKPNSAPFAFNLAGGKRKLDKKGTARKNWRQVPGLDKAFVQAKKRVREMKIRVVRIDNQAKQALFEIYAILELKTAKYNDFTTS